MVVDDVITVDQTAGKYNEEAGDESPPVCQNVALASGPDKLQFGAHCSIRFRPVIEGRKWYQTEYIGFSKCPWHRDGHDIQQLFRLP